jgi:hypothetical protein
VNPEQPSAVRWLPDRTGTTIGELLDASGVGNTSPADYHIRTCLLLTGLGFTEHDHRRVRDAIAWAREEAQA